MKRYKVNIIILNYEGIELLPKYLPGAVKAARASAHETTVTVLDNCSVDGSINFVEQNFPEVTVIQAKKNKVLCSYNEVAKNLKDDIIILLNNDMAVDEDFVDPLVAVFDQHADAFFISTYLDHSKASFHWGTLTADITFDQCKFSKDQFGYSLSAGAAAFDRLKFIGLGGYDEIYLPGRYEDLDLCYRGWKRGWKGYYEPKSVLFHEGQTSFNKCYSTREIERLVYRNSLLFMFKNITDPLLMFQFLFFLPLRILNFIVRFKFHMVMGFADVCRSLPEILQKRRVEKKNFIVKDQEVIRVINDSIQKRHQSKTVRWMRAMVDFLGKHRGLRRPFFFFGFFTIRLIFPLQYLLLRELIDCESVLDLGCGRHSMVPIIPSHIRKVGVEFFEPAYNEAAQLKRHDQVIYADLTKIEFDEKSFDGVVMLDVLEHLTKEDGEALIQKVKRWARKRIIIFTPNGFLHQECYDHNHLMEHKSGWETGEFVQKGFKVNGVRGFKFLYAPSLHPDEEKPTFRSHLCDFTQIVTYFFPRAAFQLFCVQTLGTK